MNKHYDKEFKDKVVLEDIKGEKTIQELATLYSVHPNLVVLWKKQLDEKMYRSSLSDPRKIKRKKQRNTSKRSDKVSLFA